LSRGSSRVDWLQHSSNWGLSPSQELG
jgi:hypothetical protein